MVIKRLSPSANTTLIDIEQNRRKSEFLKNIFDRKKGERFEGQEWDEIKKVLISKVYEPKSFDSKSPFLSGTVYTIFSEGADGENLSLKPLLEESFQLLEIEIRGVDWPIFLVHPNEYMNYVDEDKSEYKSMLGGKFRGPLVKAAFVDGANPKSVFSERQDSYRACPILFREGGEFSNCLENLDTSSLIFEIFYEE